MKLSLKPDIFNRALRDEQIKSMLEVKTKSGLNYSTVLKLVHGGFGTQTFAVLGRYFTSLGHKPNDIAEMQIKDIFDVKEDL